MRDHPKVRKAADALMDLNAFYAIIAICEGGCFRAASDAAVQRIIKICRKESGKRLWEFDGANAAVKAEINALSAPNTGGSPDA